MSFINKYFNEKNYNLAKTQIKNAITYLWEMSLKLNNYIKKVGLPYLKQYIQKLIFWARNQKTPSKDQIPSSLKKVSATIGREVVVVTVAWNATVLGQFWMNEYFEKKGLKNLWGLSRRRGKTVLTAEEYENIEWWTEYGTGLVMMIAVTLILKKLYELYKIKYASASSIKEENS